MKQRFKWGRGKTIAEYIIVVVLLMSCSLTLYFSVLATGTESLGNMLCNECPKNPSDAVDPWDRNSDDQDNENNDSDDEENDDNSAIPEDDNSVDDDFGGINDEFWDYFWDSFFDWDNWL
jgi:hypothetical protein